MLWCTFGFFTAGSSPALSAARTAVGSRQREAPPPPALHADLQRRRSCMHAACPTGRAGRCSRSMIDPSSARPPRPCAWHLFRSRSSTCRHCWHVRACQGTRERARPGPLPLLAPQRFQVQRWSPARRPRGRLRSSGGQAPPSSRAYESARSTRSPDRRRDPARRDVVCVACAWSLGPPT